MQTCDTLVYGQENQLEPVIISVVESFHDVRQHRWVLPPWRSNCNIIILKHYQIQHQRSRQSNISDSNLFEKSRFYDCEVNLGLKSPEETFLDIEID